MPPRTATPRLDAVCANAVELARDALLAVTEPGQVGEHLRVEATGERLVTHVFACTMPGYRGWSWVAVVARALRAKTPTVCETALIPGDDALLAPAWEPWAERLRPEDVGADDLLPYAEEDSRLEQGFEQTGDEDGADQQAHWELGLGRARVLSAEGRAEAAERWNGGDFGPRRDDRKRASHQEAVEAQCATCGFVMPLAGSIRQEFGVCANEWSTADGHVVSLRYGCGSHSETGHPERAPEPGEGVVMDENLIDYTVEPDDVEAAPEQPVAAEGHEVTTAQDHAPESTVGSQSETAQVDAECDSAGQGEPVADMCRVRSEGEGHSTDSSSDGEAERHAMQELLLEPLGV